MHYILYYIQYFLFHFKASRSRDKNDEILSDYSIRSLVKDYVVEELQKMQKDENDIDEFDDEILHNEHERLKRDG